MLGQPVSMLIPRVVGFKLNGALPDGTTATDLVLTITQMLRKHGVVGKFVEFYGAGVAAVPLANRATIGNMSPEFGSTCAIFPIDDETVRYLHADRPARRAGRAGRGVRQGAGPVARPGRPSRPTPSTSSSICPLWCPRSPARSGRRTGSSLTDAKAAFRAGAAGLRDRRTAWTRRARRASRPPTRRRRTPAPTAAGRTSRRRCTAARRHDVRARPRRRRDRLDHVLHQHVQPAGDDRRRAAGQEGRRARPDARKPWVKTTLAPGLQGGHGLLREGRPGAVPGQARLQPGRLRLHHLHRQLRPAARRGLGARSTRPTSPSSRCSPATATSRAGSTRT